MCTPPGHGGKGRRARLTPRRTPRRTRQPPPLLPQQREGPAFAEDCTAATRCASASAAAHPHAVHRVGRRVRRSGHHRKGKEQGESTVLREGAGSASKSRATSRANASWRARCTKTGWSQHTAVLFAPTYKFWAIGVFVCMGAGERAAPKQAGRNTLPSCSHRPISSGPEIELYAIGVCVWVDQNTLPLVHTSVWKFWAIGANPILAAERAERDNNLPHFHAQPDDDLCVQVREDPR